MNKSEIRNRIIKIRKSKSFKKTEINFQSILKVLKKAKIKGKILGGYYPHNYEINVIKTLYKFEKLNYFISLPKVKKNYQMDFYNWSFKCPLSINRYGIPEPIQNKIVFPDILLVPLVAYDANLNRIGYGGGFYDRYIKKIQKTRKILTIGLAYSYQKVQKILVEKHDIKLDFIITDKEN